MVKQVIEKTNNNNANIKKALGKQKRSKKYKKITKHKNNIHDCNEHSNEDCNSEGCTHDTEHEYEYEHVKNKPILDIQKYCNYDFIKYQEIKLECDKKYNEYVLCKSKNNTNLFDYIDDNLIKKYNDIYQYKNDFHKMFCEYEMLITEFNNAIGGNNNNICDDKTKEFINKVKLKFGDKYDYSKIIYETSRETIIIGCPKHGIVEQRANSFLENGCKKCSVIANKKRSNLEDFIEKANKVHNNKYDYSQVDYKLTRQHVSIICNIHGIFNQSPDHHLTGYGCKKCGTIKMAKNNENNTEEFIIKARNVHYDRYDYSKVDYKKSSIKVTIVCRTHGEFEQTPAVHIHGSGCKSCHEIINKPITNEEFIGQAKIIHNNKYNYENIYCVGYNDLIIIECPQHGIFEQMVKKHLDGIGCKQCYDLNNFITNANLVHNNKYDYSKVNYKNTTTLIIIICEKHGEFLLTPENHIRKKCKCPKCNDNITIDTFIDKAKRIYGDKYDYSKVDYKGTNTKIIIICDEHGEYTETPNNHIKLGKECFECTGRVGNVKHTKNTFIEKAKTIHGDKYDYSKVVYNTRDSKVIISCHLHGNFEVRPSKHFNGQGCPKCVKSIYTTDMFVEKATIVHENKYDYSNVICDNKDSTVLIICKEHGQFEQIGRSHLRGSGCIKCYNKEKFLERAIEIHKDRYDYSVMNYIHSTIPITIICKKHGQFKQPPSSHLRCINGCPKCNACPSCELWRTCGKLCLYCIPKDKNKLYYKSKEMDVVKFLKSNLPDNEFIHNKSVGTSCGEGHLFPDILFDLQFYHLIVEIDEHKHRGANYRCDKQRMYDIIAKLGTPCIFIRYNPDSKLSDKNILLDKVNEYLNIKPNDNSIWNEFGFKADYLFY